MWCYSSVHPSIKKKKDLQRFLNPSIIHSKKITAELMLEPEVVYYSEV